MFAKAVLYDFQIPTFFSFLNRNSLRNSKFRISASPGEQSRWLDRSITYDAAILCRAEVDKGSHFAHHQNLVFITKKIEKSPKTIFFIRKLSAHTKKTEHFKVNSLATKICFLSPKKREITKFFETMEVSPKTCRYYYKHFSTTKLAGYHQIFK